jgi:hypothetical protein
VANLFDLVNAIKNPHAEEPVRRVCVYKNYLGTPCKLDATADGFTCVLHTGTKKSIKHLRREINNNAVEAISVLTELMHTSDMDLVRLGASKVLVELSDIKAVAQQESGEMDTEELDAARRSLAHKFDLIVKQLKREPKERIA